MLKRRVEKIEKCSVSWNPICVVMPGQTKKDARARMGLNSTRKLVYLKIVGI